MLVVLLQSKIIRGRLVGPGALVDLSTAEARRAISAGEAEKVVTGKPPRKKRPPKKNRADE